MRKLLLLAAVSLLAACSSTRQQGFFYPKFENGNGALKPSETAMAPITPVEPQNLVASTSPQVVPAQSSQATRAAVAQFKQAYKQMSKPERKALRQTVKKEIRSYLKQKKAMGIESNQATKAMDRDLKLALVFAVAGILVGIFWALGGAILLVIALLFLIFWLMRQ